jgi:S1-C subfamily serine protease
MKVDPDSEDAAIVSSVKRDGFLARTGVRSGDVIRQVNEFLVREPLDFYKAIVKYREEDSIVLLLQRKNQRYYITVPLRQ